MKIIISAGLILLFGWAGMISCQSLAGRDHKEPAPLTESNMFIVPDTAAISKDQFGEMVRYGRDLMMNTAYYIGPEGIRGRYLGNKMNCTNCHQDAGTKPFSFNLMRSHQDYPQYRAREGKILTLAERVNNCIMRPHNGKPLPLDSREMVAFLSYLKWINTYVLKKDSFPGAKNMSIVLPEHAASPDRGKLLFNMHCARCHGADGAGMMNPAGQTYAYPPLWGSNAYQPGSSMHRIIMQAKWLKANMPYDSAKWNKPVLTDAEALDIAAFVNDDEIHPRPGVKSFDYPHAEEKSIDYDKAPFADPFSAEQHKYGPYPAIVKFWKNKGRSHLY